VIGGFMFVMAVFTFVHAGRKWLGSRRTDNDAPPGWARAEVASLGARRTKTTSPGGPPRATRRRSCIRGRWSMAAGDDARW